MGTKISALPGASQITGVELVPIVQGGVTSQTTTALIYAIVRTAAEIAAGVAVINYSRQELDPRRYGFVNSSSVDNSPSIQAAINVGEQYTGCTVVLPPNSNILCNTGLTRDVSKVGLDLNGSTLSFVNLTSGNAETPSTSQTGNNVPLTCIPHPMSNGTLIGPGVTVTAVTAITFNDTHMTPNLSGCCYNNIAFVNFAKDVTFNNGSFCETFTNCTFTLLSGTCTTYSVTQLGATNAGERQAFINCWWYNKPLLIDNQSGTADIRILGGSMDGFTTAVNNAGGSVVTLTDVHVESAGDTDYWFKASSTNSVIRLRGCEYVLDGNKTAFTMFYSDSTCTNGGIFVEGFDLEMGPFSYTAVYGASFGPVLCGGTGNCQFSGLAQQHNGARPAISSALGLLAYPSFESANYTAEWTLSNGAVRSAAQAHSGSDSLLFPASSGVTPDAFWTYSCRPGQYVQGNLWYLGATLATESATLSGVIEYLDKGGNVLASNGFMTITANTASWTVIPVNLVTPAPFGTVTAKLDINVFGATGACPAYVDDVLINIL